MQVNKEVHITHPIKILPLLILHQNKIVNYCQY